MGGKGRTFFLTYAVLCVRRRFFNTIVPVKSQKHHFNRNIANKKIKINNPHAIFASKTAPINYFSWRGQVVPQAPPVWQE